MHIQLRRGDISVPCGVSWISTSQPCGGGMFVPCGVNRWTNYDCNYGGKLFDPENYSNPAKANSYIRKYITEGFVPKINDEQKEHTNSYQLVDLLNFEKIEFEKIISYSNATVKPIMSKYPMVKFDKIDLLEYGESLPENRFYYHFSKNAFNLLSSFLMEYTFYFHSDKPYEKAKPIKFMF